MDRMRYIIGVDDHDSPVGGCTTHFSWLLFREFEKIQVKLEGYPRLTRLNPNIPWKTRGNASISFVVETERDIDELLDIVWNLSLDYIENVSKGYNYKRSPGVAIMNFRHDPLLEHIYWKAVTDVVTREYAVKISEKLGIKTKGARGIIGAIASMGFKTGMTYELLTYRRRENWNSPRRVDFNTVMNYDLAFFPYVYANVDYVSKEQLIVSHGNDPVLYGLRGLKPSVLLEGLKLIRSEDVEGYQLFETNQGSDHHFKTSSLKPYSSFVGDVTIKKVNVMRGGDCMLFGYKFPVIVYKETGELNQAVRYLLPGDTIKVYGAVKPSAEYGLVIEAERIDITELKPDQMYVNPRCPLCGGSSESLGRNKGFRCRKCRNKFKGDKIIQERPRSVTIGVYQTRKYRHLTKPIFLETIYDSKEDLK